MAGPAARASGRPRLVAYLSAGRGPEDLAKPLAALGFLQGKNLRFETRIRREADPAALASTAAELVALRPDAMIAWSPRVFALAAATRTIPIVCGGVPDPVAAGLARTLQRPGGNVTGLSMGFPEMSGIAIGLLRQLRPGLKALAMIHPPGLPVAPAFRDATRAAGLRWLEIPIAGAADLERALAPLAGEAVFMGPFFEDTDSALQRHANEVAMRHRIAVLGSPQDGALMAYGLEHSDIFGRLAAILAKVLRGANPAEIPFELPDRSWFVLNRTTAKAIGIQIPPDIVLRATEIID